MDFAYTSEQNELRTIVRGFLGRRSSEEAVRATMETEAGFDAELWRQLGEELGVLGLAIPQEYGGMGFTFVELGVLLEEAGRSLACVPLLSSVVLAANAILLSDSEGAKQTYLPQLATGELRGTVAIAEDSGSIIAAAVNASARPGADGWILDGHKSFVVDGCTADLILVAARTDDGVALFAVEGNAAGLSRAPLPSLDATRRLARLELSGTPARLIGSTDAWSTIARLVDLTSVALAAEQIGGAARVLEMTLDYARIRHQFGRPIGDNQAISHTCADLYIQIEAARAAAHYACWAAAEGRDDLDLIASIAQVRSSAAFADTVAATIQIHGAIGFTWEHPAHLYFKRAQGSRLLFGTPGAQLGHAADRLLPTQPQER